jgi:hypothetical protein
MAAPTRTRRTALIIAIALATLEIGLFASAWRLGALLDPGNDRRAALGFIVLGTALTLQAMVIVGVAWALVAWSRTTLIVDDGNLALEHPWREWSGGWHEVRSAWVLRGWLTIEIEDQWRRWYVHAGTQPDAIDRIRDLLPPGAWLEGADLKRHLVRTMLPLLLVGVGAGGLILVSVIALMNRALR